jgi:hypothetical protein
MTWLLTGNDDAQPGSFLGTTNAQPLVINTNNQQAMRVASADGDVSIGDQGGTRSPDYKLDVQGILNADDIYKDGAKLVGSQWEDVTDDGINYGAGNVGIGKAPAANYKLDVAGTLNATDLHKNGSPLISSQWQNVSSGISYAAGNVGIGKAPGSSYNLDVAGSINATEIYRDGAPLEASQWTDVSGDISYSTGDTQYQAMRDGLTIESNYRTPLVLRLQGGSPTQGALWRMWMGDGYLSFDVNTSRNGDFSNALSVLELSYTGAVQIARDATIGWPGGVE